MLSVAPTIAVAAATDTTAATAVGGGGGGGVIIAAVADVVVVIVAVAIAIRISAAAAAAASVVFVVAPVVDDTNVDAVAAASWRPWLKLLAQGRMEISDKCRGNPQKGGSLDQKCQLQL